MKLFIILFILLIPNLGFQSARDQELTKIGELKGKQDVFSDNGKSIGDSVSKGKS